MTDSPELLYLFDFNVAGGSPGDCGEAGLILSNNDRFPTYPGQCGQKGKDGSVIFTNMNSDPLENPSILISDVSCEYSHGKLVISNVIWKNQAPTQKGFEFAFSTDHGASSVICSIDKFRLPFEMPLRSVSSSKLIFSVEVMLYGIRLTTFCKSILIPLPSIDFPKTIAQGGVFEIPSSEPFVITIESDQLRIPPSSKIQIQKDCLLGSFPFDVSYFLNDSLYYVSKALINVIAEMDVHQKCDILLIPGEMPVLEFNLLKRISDALDLVLHVGDSKSFADLPFKNVCLISFQDMRSHEIITNFTDNPDGSILLVSPTEYIDLLWESAQNVDIEASLLQDKHVLSLPTKEGFDKKLQIIMNDLERKDPLHMYMWTKTVYSVNRLQNYMYQYGSASYKRFPLSKVDRLSIIGNIFYQKENLEYVTNKNCGVVDTCSQFFKALLIVVKSLGLRLKLSLLGGKGLVNSENWRFRCEDGREYRFDRVIYAALLVDIQMDTRVEQLYNIIAENIADYSDHVTICTIWSLLFYHGKKPEKFANLLFGKEMSQYSNNLDNIRVEAEKDDFDITIFT